MKIFHVIKKKNFQFHSGQKTVFSIVHQKTSSGGEGAVQSQPTARNGGPSHALARKNARDPDGVGGREIVSSHH